VNIIKRLFNVFSLLGGLTFLLGVGFGVVGYKQFTECKQHQQALFSAEAGQDLPFQILDDQWVLYSINGKRIKAAKKLTQEEVEEIRADIVESICEEQIEASKRGNEPEFFLISLILILATLVLNYTLFGKVRLWHKAEPSANG